MSMGHYSVKHFLRAGIKTNTAVCANRINVGIEALGILWEIIEL